MNLKARTIRAMDLSWPLKLTTWVVIATQLAAPFGSQIFAIELAGQTAVATSASTPSYPDPILTPQSVTVNRTAPAVAAPSPELRFSANPTENEILNARVFDLPLVAFGAMRPAENQSLAQALLAYANRTDPDDASAIESFLAAFPDSPRSLSLLANLASHYRATLQFSKALATWPKVWELGRNSANPEAAAIVDAALAEWADLLVTFGRMQEIESLLQMIGDRSLRGPAASQIQDVRSALWQMQNEPGQTFKCGPFALYRIRKHEQMTNALHSLIFDEQSTTNGTSLTQMSNLARRMSMNLQMARRSPGAEIPMPSMVHWSLGHFSTVVKKEGDRFLIEDPTFAPTWITAKTLDQEASGYFLLPEGPLPTGWAVVGDEEGNQVWGRSTPGASNPNAVTPCDESTCPQPNGGDSGMARYNVHLLRVSLRITDAPVGYQPPVGPAVVFRASYNERDTNQPAVFNYSNLGNQWTFDWLSYIQDNPTNTNSTVSIGMRVSGGGAEFRTATQSNGVLAVPMFPRTRTRLAKTSTNIYELTYQDGSKRVYGVATAGSPRKVFLSSISDPAGNSINFTYDANFRIVSVTDAIGQVTTVSYGSTNTTNSLFYKITRVTDPFGRYATFQYNTSGQLTNITDVIGMSSAFTYGAPNQADFINSLTTPYGTTTFTNNGNSFSRWIEITDPMGEKERVEFLKTTAPGYPVSEPSNLVPEGFDLDNRHMPVENTFYWDRKAMEEAPGDYTKARETHWISTEDSWTVLEGVKASTKAPLEQRVWYQHPGQMLSGFGWIQMGPNWQPSAIARVLDDGTSQTYSLEYNQIQKISKVTDPARRATQFVYQDPQSGNPEDLLEIRQQIGILPGNTELLAKFTYNSQHVPLTAVDASGQTNKFGYNARAQLTAITNARSEVINFAYDTNGYLTNISGAMPEAPVSLTYDGYGRVRTMTDGDGSTVTYDYDGLDRPTKVTYLDGSFEQIVYEKLDPVLNKDRRGHWSRKIYNARRQLTAIADALGRVTQLGWCNCGSLESITDPLGRTTTWMRDVQGRVTGKIYPDATLVSYAYEQYTSRLKSVTDAKNQTTLYDYFKDDNLKQVTYSNPVILTPSVSFTYDTNYNRISTMIDGIGTTTYSYNVVTNTQLGAGRLLSIDGPLSNDTISYMYDELGRVKSRAINGVAQAVTYDSLGRVTIVTNALGSFTNVYVGNSSRVATNYYPNGQTTTFGYYNVTNDLRLQTIWHRNGSGTNISRFDYAYDADGQIAKWTQQADAQTQTVWGIEYDPADQLASVIKSNGVTGVILNRFVYGYDKAGNRMSEYTSSDDAVSPSTSVMGGTFNNLNQLTAVSGGGKTRVRGSLNELGTVSVDGTPAPVDSRNTNFVGYTQLSLGSNVFSVVATDYSNNKRTNNYQLVLTNNGTAQTLTYDLNGNLVSAVSATLTNTYEWDAADRLLAVSIGTNRSEFSYDGVGRRIGIIEKQNGTPISTNKFLWCAGVLCEQRDASGGSVSRRFLRSGEQISGAAYFYTYDHLGSIRESTDSTGAIRARYDYDSYGRKTKLSGDIDADFGFTGHYFHPASGLHLALFRAYDAGVGRWLSRDPIEEVGGVNLYRYVQNNPMNEVDPLGLWNVWNPATWGDRNAAGWSWADSLTPWHESSGYNWQQIKQTTLEADAAFWDGVIPFWDPYSDLYDPCDNSLEWSKRIGEWTRDAELAIATAGSTVEAETADQIGLQVTKNNWLKDNLFRWGYGKWGNPAQEGFHFHAAPVMKYHLPYQAQTWFYHSAAEIARFAINAGSKWTPLY